MKRFEHDYTGMNDDPDGDYVLYEDHVLALMAQDKLLAARGATIVSQDKRIAELEHALANTEACLYARNTSLEGAEVRITKLERKLSESRSANGRWARGLDYVGALETRIAELEADRRVLQSTGEHPAPCARHCEANAFRIELRNKDARIAELEAPLRAFHDEVQDTADQHMLHLLGRIAELEKQAAIDKTLLALADARINRELRDDFAGRAMQGLLAQPGMTVDIDGDYIGQCRAELAYGLADALLKAKGGA